MEYKVPDELKEIMDVGVYKLCTDGKNEFIQGEYLVNLDEIKCEFNVNVKDNKILIGVGLYEFVFDEIDNAILLMNILTMKLLNV